MRQESLFFCLGSREEPQCGKRHEEMFKIQNEFFLLPSTTLSIIQGHIVSENINPFLVLSVWNMRSSELTIE
jgi:hypothetical protein